jgi:hypothetical protein
MWQITGLGVIIPVATGLAAFYFSEFFLRKIETGFDCYSLDDPTIRLLFDFIIISRITSTMYLIFNINILLFFLLNFLTIFPEAIIINKLKHNSNANLKFNTLFVYLVKILLAYIAESILLLVLSFLLFMVLNIFAFILIIPLSVLILLINLNIYDKKFSSFDFEFRSIYFHISSMIITTPYFTGAILILLLIFAFSPRYY